MKRILALILCLLIPLSFTGCTRQPELSDPVCFYYLRIQTPDNIHHGSEDSVLYPEIREGFGIRYDYDTLLRTYLAGPVTDGYLSPFPENTTVVDWTIDGTVMHIVLSDSISRLDGIDLTLACACLSKTVMDIYGMESVQIQAETANLDGKTEIIMDHDVLVLLDQIQRGTSPEHE